MEIQQGTYVLTTGSKRDWNRAGRVYGIASDGSAHIVWNNGGYVTTTPVSQLTTWSQR
jgi:hypothetical protein